MRLLRYLLRGFDRSMVALRRFLGRFDRGRGLVGRTVLVTGSAALVVAVSFALPGAAVGGTTTGGTTTTTAVSAVGIDQSGIPDANTPANSPVSNNRVGTTSTTTSSTTTSSTTTSTTTTSTTTTTTTTLPPDTMGPVVSGISDGPDPIFTSGNPPDTSHISAIASDPAGVASMTVYYRVNGGAFSVWTAVKGGSVSTNFGPFAIAGTYDYRIMATDTLGNANCKTASSCPGGSVTVVIP